MRTNRRYSFGLIIIACGLMGACSGEPTRVGPKFTGRLLLLTGDNTNGADLVELTSAPSGSGYNVSTLTQGIFEAAPNPDQTKLLYATKEEIALRDLHTGAVKPLVKGQSFCLAWAPDGNHFSYRQKLPGGEKAGDAGSRSKLFASDLDGKTRQIWEDLTANSDCAHWTAPDRLIFDRFLGGSTKPKTGGEALKPNTTTIAMLSEPVKLTDAPRNWSIEAVCLAGNTAILRPHDEAQPLFLIGSLDQLKTTKPTPAPCSGCRFAGFAAKSCVPFFIEESSSTSSELFYLNPTNWQRQRSAHIGQTFSLNAKMLIKSSARLMILGDAPDSLLLIDAESGDTAPFFPKSGQPATSEGRLPSPVPIVWIEN